MKEKNNKILIAIIMALAVVIVILAVILVLGLITEFNVRESSVEKIDIRTTMENAEKLETTTQETTTLALDMSQFNLGIYTVDGQAVDSVYVDGGTYLEIITLSENEVSFTYTSISAAPANRIADITIQNAEIIDGKAEFTFDNDGWYNRGTGYIEFGEDGKIEISTSITRMSEDAMFSIYPGTQTLTFNQE